MLIGIPPTAYVAIVETSMDAATINQLSWIKIPAIAAFLIVSIGLVFPDHRAKIFCKIDHKIINHNPKFAKFLQRFRNCRRGASI
jgi:hypothetical protein